MKRFLTILLISTAVFLSPSTTVTAQELHGSTLNLGVGIGGRQVSVFHIDYEFDVAPAITVAPFISFYDYSNFIPIGVKGSLYFDDMIGANSDWDLYLAGSLGLGIVSNEWDTDYYRDRYNYRGPNAVFLNIHVGGEYHFNPRFGMFLDLSGGATTIGIALH